MLTSRSPRTLASINTFRNLLLSSVRVSSRRNYGSDHPDVAHHERFISKEEVHRFMVDCMKAIGTSELKANMIAANLTAADCRGHFSHGLNRLSYYVDDVKKGCCNPNADPQVLKESPSTAWVDGNNGLGVVVGTFSMELAMKKAQESGVGWVSAKGSNHFGICQWYTDMALAKGLIGISSTNTSPFVTPTRGKKAVFGTNPICVSAPAKDGDSFTLDMSTSAVAVGKIEMQLRKNEPLPSLGWALGPDGRPTQDTVQAYHHGCGLMPLGGDETNSGYKGYGLALLVELLCGIMAGSSYAPNIRKWTGFDRVANLGQCFIAVNPDCFAPGLSDRLQDVMNHLRSLEPADPKKPVLVPGDPERLNNDAVNKKGAIFYTVDHIRTYRQFAEQLGVSPLRSVPGCA